MREPNFSFPSQNRAAVVISSALYDRRALDCTATLPLVNSLTHLAYMTSTSPRIREILAADGGLERLVKILATCQNTDRHSLWKWSLAFQCMVNVGVRGTEAIRSRVVETGAVHVVLAILENFLRALDQDKASKDHDRKQLHQPLPATATALSLPTVPLQPTQSRSTPITPSRRFFGQLSSDQQLTPDRPFVSPKRRTFITRTPKPKPKPVDPSLSSIPLLNSLSPDAILHREEDILLSLQLLAYLSKYPHIRESFHKNHRRNVFSVVEKFTYRFHPPTVIYWAGVIMRNACRKDEARGGIRQCAYMHCGKWERFPREFAKCRRCRKAKYCSKACQSKAWQEGHKYWCVERPHSTQPPATTTTSSATAAAAAAVVAAAPQPAPQPDQVMHLEPHGATPDVMPIPIEERQSELTQVDDATGGNNEPTRHRSSISFPSANNHPLTSNNDRNTGDAHPASLIRGHSGRDHHHHHHLRRRNSRSAHSVPSGSSTEVETEVADNAPMRDMMDVD